MHRLPITLFIWALASLGLASLAGAQEVDDPQADEQRLQDLDKQTVELQRQINELDRDVDRKLQNVSTGGISFLFGAFCALWAQNTGRNAWLWFFLGLFFSVIAVLVLLYKNSMDRDVALQSS